MTSTQLGTPTLENLCSDSRMMDTLQHAIIAIEPMTPEGTVAKTQALKALDEVLSGQSLGTYPLGVSVLIVDKRAGLFMHGRHGGGGWEPIRDTWDARVDPVAQASLIVRSTTCTIAEGPRLAAVSMRESGTIELQHIAVVDNAVISNLGNTIGMSLGWSNPELDHSTELMHQAAAIMGVEVPGVNNSLVRTTTRFS